MWNFAQKCGIIFIIVNVVSITVFGCHGHISKCSVVFVNKKDKEIVL